MGFCRRCGEIVPASAARCKCGGSAVAPSVPWAQSTQTNGGDKWAKTYVSTPPEQSRTTDKTIQPEKSSVTPAPEPLADISPTKPARRFPRPLSAIVGPSRFNNTRVSAHIASSTRARTPSPTKTSFLETVTESPPADVLKSPDNETLSKAYGSILQPPETLPIHTCAICFSIFPPDATIYPDPQNISGKTTRFLCKSCFAANGGSKGNCASCGREVLASTKDGLFIENGGSVWHKRCFRCDTCDKDIGNMPMVDLFGRPSCAECFDTCLNRKSTPKKKLGEVTNKIGGMKGNSRESSPALEELSERLGVRLRASVDAISPSSSPSRTGRKEQLGGSLGGSISTDVQSSPRTSLQNISNPSTPTRSFNRSPSGTPKGPPTPLKIMTTGNSKCEKCRLQLFNHGGDGKIVTVPAGDAMLSYHASCFCCTVCGDAFKGNDKGQAIFVKNEEGACHPECAGSPVRASLIPKAISELGPKSAPPLTKSFPRFGCSDSCPGCHISVSPMERGVVAGPQNTRWHTSCLVCGGKGAQLPRPGCGKRLDSGAKTDLDGGIWCRECMLLLPRGSSGSPQPSPTRRLTPSFTGTLGAERTSRPESRIFAQMTGSGLTRQYTGGLSRAGSVSPTRQLSTRSVSPTKGLMGATRHSRPAGTWRNKSVDEGRGMFLVRQMTGNTLT